MKKTRNIFILTSFSIGLALLFLFPLWKDYVISTLEITTEIWLLLELTLFYFRSKKNHLNTALICFSIFFLLIADVMNGLQILKITDSHDLIADYSYVLFALFLLIFLIFKLNVFNKSY